MRIAAVTDRDWINANYRSFPLAALQARGHEVQVHLDSERLRPDDLRGCDVVHVYRLREAEIRALVEAARARGAAIVWDDDDFNTAPTVSRAALHAQRARAEVTRMLGLVDVATTPSAMLAEHFRAWGGEQLDVRVIENYLPDTYAPPPAPEPAPGITIGWTAAAEHLYDLERLGLVETLRRLLERFPQLRVASIGIDLRLPRERYHHTMLVQFHELAAHVARFDVGIAPLADIHFNRARSNAKLKEYAAAGVPWLASPIGPYAGFGERQGGRLVPDDGWEEALARLLERPRERRKLAKRGRKWASGQTVARNLHTWETALADAVAIARGRARSAGAAAGA